MYIELFILFTISILGAVCASFIGCIIDNPEKTFSFIGRSSCDYCKKTLKFFELVPIFSYIIFWGKCRNCKNLIKINYLIYELILATLFPISWLIFSEYFILSQIIQLFILLTFCFIVFLDWEKMLISIEACILIFLFSFILWTIENNFQINILFYKILGGVLGFFSLWCINKVYFLKV